MIIEKPICPECGKYVEGIVEMMTCLAQVQEPTPEGETDYAGGSEFYYDTQEAEEMPEGGFEIRCGQGHSWISHITW